MEDVNILFVCTGNLCRSPSAAAFFERWVAQGQGQGYATDDPAHITVESTGMLGSTSEVPTRLVKEAEAFGLTLDEHISTRISRSDIRRVDLVVAMAREHVREIVLADNGAFPKTFTLREIVRRGQEKGPRQPGETLERWLQRLNAGRRHLDLIGDSPEDDIKDPMGGRSAEFHDMLVEVEALTRALYGLIWPGRSGGSGRRDGDSDGAPVEEGEQLRIDS
jgi:protein-tyrosine phosphatase